MAGRLLPRRILDPIAALYAYCRVADDLVDEGAEPARGLVELERRTEALFLGRPQDAPADRAFAATVERYRIPRAVVELLLEGFRWDVERRRYETLDEVAEYGARVAGTVGVMLTLILGERRPSMLARAADLGVAMQLTNIARDVGEDARRGRLYLPLGLLRDAGVVPEQLLATPRFEPGIGEVVAAVLAAAEPLYLRADLGLVGLPRSARLGLAVARRFYAEIGARVRAAGHDSVSARRFVPLGRKIGLALRTLPILLGRGDGGREPPLPATRRLVEVASGGSP